MLAQAELYSHNHKTVNTEGRARVMLLGSSFVCSTVLCWLNLAAVPECVGKDTADTRAEARCQLVHRKTLACRTLEVLRGHKHEDQAGTGRQP